jgi:hypothetical protein
MVLKYCKISCDIGNIDEIINHDHSYLKNYLFSQNLKDHLNISKYLDPSLTIECLIVKIHLCMVLNVAFLNFI